MLISATKDENEFKVLDNLFILLTSSNEGALIDFVVNDVSPKNRVSFVGVEKIKSDGVFQSRD